jgi:hypothetical protein
MCSDFGTASGVSDINSVIDNKLVVGVELFLYRRCFFVDCIWLLYLHLIFCCLSFSGLLVELVTSS